MIIGVKKNTRAQGYARSPNYRFVALEKAIATLTLLIFSPPARLYIESA